MGYSRFALSVTFQVALILAVCLGLAYLVMATTYYATLLLLTARQVVLRCPSLLPHSLRKLLALLTTSRSTIRRAKKRLQSGTQVSLMR